jgi:hypothetical protein
MLAACLVLALAWPRPTPGQPPAAAGSKAGKYQVTVCTSAAVLCDIETGELWMCEYDRGRWQDWHGMPSPVKR